MSVTYDAAHISLVVDDCRLVRFSDGSRVRIGYVDADYDYQYGIDEVARSVKNQAGLEFEFSIPGSSTLSEFLEGDFEYTREGSYVGFALQLYDIKGKILYQTETAYVTGLYRLRDKSDIEVKIFGEMTEGCDPEFLKKLM